MKNIGSKLLTSVVNFTKKDFASGVILFCFAILAMIVANSGLAVPYNDLLHKEITIGIGSLSLSMSVLHWINDGLMALFFLVVGMEIKRELVFGELRSFKKIILPVSAAIGGLAVPALIYVLFNFNEPTINGWGIPMATDIAFALGVLSIVGRKAPKGIVVFLTALAIVDDLGAIIVIAVFYTSQISWWALLAGLVILAGLALMNRLKFNAIGLYIVGGILLWICFLKSGIHPTIAGVLLGMVLPMGKNETAFKTSVLHRIESKLAPWTAFIVMPIFAFANSGITINWDTFADSLFEPVSLGILFGLIVGKQVGIFGVSYILTKLKIAALPFQVKLSHLYGASVLGGIGFTMSLFVAGLSFTDEATLATAKLSIMLASCLAMLLGAIVYQAIAYRFPRFRSLSSPDVIE